MKLHFDPNLSFQQEAIASVVKLFDGAPFVRPEDRLFYGVSVNRLPLLPEAVYKNRDAIAQDNGITDAHPTDELDFTIEMETGTGKTYVYLRTILELHKAYGLSKFIIVVPSIAVREGVIKTLDITREHFKALYNVNYRYFAYDSGKPTDIRSFAQSSTLQIMVMNKQAFDSDDRIINQERDTNAGEKLIKLIEETGPVVILDEPQMGMDTENFLPRLQALGPIFKLRYSATHKVVKNLIYQLTPFDAYNKRLVKTVEVLSVHEDDRQSNVSIELADVKFSETGKPPVAKLSVYVRLAGGDFKEKTLSCKPGDDLEHETNNPVYNGWTVERIWKDAASQQVKVRFTNGTEILSGGRHGWPKEDIFREQMRLAIEKHFEKKARLKSQDIKVLSLFFIDRVANYIEEDGLIRRLFEEEYRKKAGFAAGADISPVHNGYFAKTGQGEYTDSETSMGKNSEVFQLIMRDKERLLSFEEPLEFIFSHSALGVGWDNPNVFNICTLNETESTIKKRQEIGRGLRICVGQDGNRLHDAEDAEPSKLINLLTVIPNQSYYAFVKTYQDELAEEYGVGNDQPVPRNARKKATTVRLNRANFDGSDFDQLWRRISKKTKWSVHFDEPHLIKRCAEEVSKITVPAPTLKADLNRIVRIEAGETVAIRGEYVGDYTAKPLSAETVELDLVDTIAKETWLATPSVLAILEQITNAKEFIKNPVVWLSKAVQRIKAVMKEEMVRIVRYEPLAESYGKSEFKEMFDTYADTIQADHSIYDRIEVDSSIEYDFAGALDGENKVSLFIKLPGWYEIDTPIGKYNPDWALVIEKTALEGDKATTQHYFVVETKGTSDLSKLREEERTKIECAVKHFEAIGLKEYLAPIDTIQTFKEKANAKIGTAVI